MVSVSPYSAALLLLLPIVVAPALALLLTSVVPVMVFVPVMLVVSPLIVTFLAALPIAVSPLCNDVALMLVGPRMVVVLFLLPMLVG